MRADSMGWLGVSFVGGASAAAAAVLFCSNNGNGADTARQPQKKTRSAESPAPQTCSRKSIRLRVGDSARDSVDNNDARSGTGVLLELSSGWSAREVQQRAKEALGVVPEKDVICANGADVFPLSYARVTDGMEYIVSVADAAWISRSDDLRGKGNKSLQAAAKTRPPKGAEQRSQYLDALQNYRQALLVIPEDGGDKAVQLRALSKTNAAQTLIRMDLFEEAVTMCDEVLQENPQLPKTILRKAQALGKLQRWVDGRDALKSGLALCEDDPKQTELVKMFKQELDEAEKKVAELERKQQREKERAERAQLPGAKSATRSVPDLD